jgi:lysophospholipase L1-like esterase
MRQLRSVLGAVLLAVALAAPAAATSEASDGHARQYYLSLGDSLAAGVQPIGDPDRAFRTNDGYADQLFAIARQDVPKLSLVKLGCPGETTTSMVNGGICSYRHGSQLDEAVHFLESHRPFVAFVTIDIGANDFPCQTDLSCVPGGVASVQANLPVITAALREAAGPDVPIVGMTLYNPFLGYWLAGPDGQQFAQATTFDAIVPLNNLFEGLFAAAGASTADVEGAFSTTDFTTMVSLPGAGEVPLNVARICMWTWICAPAPFGPDNHANAAGYGVIAQAFAAELGY